MSLPVSQSRDAGVTAAMSWRWTSVVHGLVVVAASTDVTASSSAAAMAHESRISGAGAAL